jgi:hypothetical protein
MPWAFLFARVGAGVSLVEVLVSVNADGHMEKRKRRP